MAAGFDSLQLPVSLDRAHQMHNQRFELVDLRGMRAPPSAARRPKCACNRGLPHRAGWHDRPCACTDALPMANCGRLRHGPEAVVAAAMPLLAARGDWLPCDQIENESSVRAVWSRSHRARRRR